MELKLGGGVGVVEVDEMKEWCDEGMFLYIFHELSCTRHRRNE